MYTWTMQSRSCYDWLPLVMLLAVHHNMRCVIVSLTYTTYSKWWVYTHTSHLRFHCLGTLKVTAIICILFMPVRYISLTVTVSCSKNIRHMLIGNSQDTQCGSWRLKCPTIGTWLYYINADPWLDSVFLTFLESHRPWLAYLHCSLASQIPTLRRRQSVLPSSFKTWMVRSFTTSWLKVSCITQNSLQSSHTQLRSRTFTRHTSKRLMLGVSRYLNRDATCSSRWKMRQTICFCLK